jgi:aspartate/methionine/tyrosine aminotransferase
VFTDDELSAIATLCLEHDVIAITDEVYEEMVYDGEHRRLATYDGMWDRTVTLSSLGKTFSLTGWKLGWGIAPPALTAGLRAAHQFLTFTTPTPVQHGAIAAMAAPTSFYDELRSSYLKKRDLLADGLKAVGFEVHRPQGTYFMMAGFDRFGFDDDRTFCRYLAETTRVVAIPPSVFYHQPEDGSKLVRFAFCKDDSILVEALDRMSALT